MNLEVIKTAVSNKTARQVLLTQKHSPKILFGAGVVGILGATVLACRATLKVNEALEQHEKHKDFIIEEGGTEQISHEEAASQLNKLKVHTALTIAKPYLPALGLGVISIAALTGSHVVLTKRNTTAMATLATVQTAYDKYRDRVVKELGLDKDREFAYGAESITVEEKLANGTVKKTEKKIVDTKRGLGNPFAVVFDESSSQWSREPGRNMITVGMVQQYANDKLRTKGHLFLNDVYEMLGLPNTGAGALCGWVYRPDNEEQVGDNFVDFRIWDGDSETVKAFVDGDERNVIIDPNVQGPIWELIDKLKV